MLVEFSMSPTGVSESLSEHVAKVLDLVDKSGLKYKINPMGTVVEGEWDEVMQLIKDCHHILLEASPRVYTRIAIDDRKGHDDQINAKVRSVEKLLNRKLKK